VPIEISKRFSPTLRDSDFPFLCCSRENIPSLLAFAAHVNLAEAQEKEAAVRNRKSEWFLFFLGRGAGIEPRLIYP
jgi:hypothetical protein